MLIDYTSIKTEAMIRALDAYCRSKHGHYRLCDECRRIEEITVPKIINCPKKNVWTLCHIGHRSCFSEKERETVLPFLEYLSNDFSEKEEAPFVRIRGTDSRESLDKRCDPRYIKVHEKLKEALLDSLMEKRFRDITVAEICRRAGIERKSFYNHCSSIMDLVDDCVHDFTQKIDFMPSQASFSRWRRNPYGKPMCTLIREDKRYQKLLYDPSISDHCLLSIIAFTIPWSFRMMHEGMGVDRKQVESIIAFSISGCFSMIRMHLEEDEETWLEIKNSIDRFNNGGLRIIVIS